MGIQIQLFGGLSIKQTHQAFSLGNTARLQVLLAYLALHHHAPVPRAQAAFVLWPDSSEEQAQTNLRKLLHQIRVNLPDIIVEDSRTLQLRGNVDVLDFYSALELASRHRNGNQPEAEQAALQCAITLYNGDLLPGSYDEWIIPERENLRQKFIHASDRLVFLLEQRKHYRDAILCANRLLQIDPLREETYRQLIRLHTLKGDRAAALSLYHNCAGMLSTQLGVEPDAATRQLYESLREKTDTSPLPILPVTYPLVGRDVEWSTLETSWQLAVAGNMRVHILHGEAGIGKTRLAEDFLRWSGRQGILTGSAVCYESGQDNSFNPLATWLRARPPDWLEPHRRREIARILPEVLTAQDPAPAAITEGWQRKAFLDVLSQALVGDGTPLLLLLDDIQWCDRDTLEWLEHFIQSYPAAKLLIIATLREGEIAPTDLPLTRCITHLRQQSCLSETHLPRLDAAQTADLASCISGNAITDPAFFAETEGVPLFIVEMARHRLASAQDTSAPARFSPILQATLLGRLESLSFSARALAQAAAVLGREFNLRLISAISGMTELETMLALDELWQKRILREAGGGTYSFIHARLRDVVLIDLSPVRLRWLHMQSARALEQTNDDFSAVALHYAAADEPAYAAEALGRAAAREISLYALEDARKLLERALALDSRPSFALYEQYGDTLNLIGMPRQASEAYGKALVACHVSDWQSQARLHRSILNCISRIDYDSARNAYQQGSANLLKAPLKDQNYWFEWLELQLTWLRANYWVRNEQEIARVIDLLDDPLARLGTPLQRIQYRHSIVLYYMTTHRFTATPTQVEMAQQNIFAARELQSPFQQAELLSSLGFVALLAGNFSESQRAYTEAVAIAEEHNFLNILERCYAYLAISYRREKNPALVADMVEKLSSISAKTTLHAYLPMISAQQAWLAYRSGEVSLAQDLSVQAFQTWGEEPAPYPLQWVGRVVLLALRVGDGNLAQAAEHAQALLNPNQQQLTPGFESALQTALTSTGPTTLECWQQAIAAAQDDGYL